MGSGSPRRNKSFQNNERREKKFDEYVSPPSWCNTYTPLNTFIEQILHAIGNQKYINKPCPTKPIPNVDNRKRCEYHKEFSYITRKCQKLMDGIQWLIQHGYLKEYILKHVKKKGNKEEKSERSKQSKGIINTIVGATEPWATSKRKESQHLRAIYILAEGTLSADKNQWNVTFSGVDSEVLQDYENDPIVIMVQIANFEVKRILVDNGAAVEIQSWEAFKAKHVDESNLRQIKHVSGFASQPIAIKGNITLSIMLLQGEN